MRSSTSAATLVDDRTCRRGMQVDVISAFDSTSPKEATAFCPEGFR
jgi:hypothetical protein